MAFLVSKSILMKLLNLDYVFDKKNSERMRGTHTILWRTTMLNNLNARDLTIQNTSSTIHTFVVRAIQMEQWHLISSN